MKILLTKRSMVLSPSIETFKVGERGENEDKFCTCQGNSASEREVWVDDIMRIILSLQGDDIPRFGKETGGGGNRAINSCSETGRTSLASRLETSAGPVDAGVAKSDEEGQWAREWPSDDDSDTDDSSAFGDGHYR